MIPDTLDKLGYQTWSQSIDSLDIPEHFALARITEVNKNGYAVSTGVTEIAAVLSGKFMFDAQEATDFPTVGDWVTVQIMDDSSLAIIHAVMPRQSLLKRKESGKRIEFQLIAANIDFGLVVQSADDPNFNLIDRYFVMLNDAGIRPIAVFSKKDLVAPNQLDVITQSMKDHGYDFVLISNVSDNGTVDLSDILALHKSYCLLGQSGVGKTSLLNKLIGTQAFKVSDVREKDGKGRHTTVRRQLTSLESGSIFIDTPGMRELGNFDIGHGLHQTFGEFAELAEDCRYRDCTHTHEDGCAILAAVENGDIDKDRYQNYLKLKKESAHYDMSYQERRKKDKSFGKIRKNYIKTQRSST